MYITFIVYRINCNNLFIIDQNINKFEIRYRRLKKDSYYTRGGQTSRPYEPNTKMLICPRATRHTTLHMHSLALTLQFRAQQSLITKERPKSWPNIGFK